MEKQKITLETNLSDINLHQCGSEKCVANHAQGPAIRPYYLLHFVISGKGIFETNGVKYELSAGQAFLISPNQVSFYRANSENPWEYSWVAFDGIKAEHYLKMAGLSKTNPIFTALNPISVQKSLVKMVDEARKSTPSETRLIGYMYLFLATLAENCKTKIKAVTSTKDAYIQKSIQYIDINSWRKITVDELSKHIGLDRSYLCHIFKEKLKMSPQDFIIKFKIDRACEMLLSTDMMIADIAQLVGYTDQLGFTRVFKSRTGASPSYYRKNNQNV